MQQTDLWSFLNHASKSLDRRVRREKTQRTLSKSSILLFSADSAAFLSELGG